MKFFILLALCLGVSIGGHSQIRQDNKSIGSKAIVFLCDSTSSDVGLTVIDGIP